MKQGEGNSRIIIKSILESIVEEIKFESLPGIWSSIDVESFSGKKRLWNFQQEAVKNCLKCLYLFFKEDNADKSKFYRRYVLNGLDRHLENYVDIKVSKLKEKLLDILSRYYPIEDNTIRFENFTNRASFWMATGSGKTLVIIKLIEALKRLMDAGEIPKKDILFLTYRDDLLNQFKKHVEEFNELFIERGFKITLKSLTEYEKVKKESLIPYFNEIIVFYYKSDCISDEQKEKIIDFRNYENGGNWYVFLDEAHKGDKEESKRQFFYSIMSRNGFLFNFSATFVDPRDIITTVFNFNLERFISEGYGKHIYILKRGTEAFREKEDYNEDEKKRIVLKALALLTYIKKRREIIKQVDPSAYHEPLMLTLVNTVNFSKIKKENQPDLKLFFSVLESIGKEDVSDKLLEEAIEELISEFHENPLLLYENIPIKIDEDELRKIKLKDILYYVYNAETPGNIEVLLIPGRRQEAVLKLKTSDKPFALIKIGDAISWIKNNLKGYEIIESYEDKSIFENIDQKEEISILMGSRAFYEGWDSNRPNLILFINIGVGDEAKKFIIQSIGRGVRIEPIKNKRKRLVNLYNQKEDNGLSEKIGSELLFQPIETLFIFGVNKNVLIEVMKHLEIERKIETRIELEVNPRITEYILLIPMYKDVGKLYLQVEPQKFVISRKCLDYVKTFFNITDERVIVAMYDIEPRLISYTKNSFQNEEKYYKIDNTKNFPLNLAILKLITHFNLNFKDIDRFKKLEDEIIHFKKIKVFLEKREDIEELKEKINKVKRYPERFEEEKMLEEKYGKIPKSVYDRLSKEISEKYPKEEIFKDLRIKYVAEHLYIPLILSTKEKIDYIKHIIKTKSEVNFINQLEKIIEENKNSLDTLFDWWLFSKIDENLDKIYIPYYDPDTNRIREFYPDFIFWFKKGNRYHIAFVDPKSIRYTEFMHKVDGFRRIFERDSTSRVFEFEGLKITVSLHLYTEDVNLVGENYRKYWIDSVKRIFEFASRNI